MSNPRVACCSVIYNKVSYVLPNCLTNSDDTMPSFGLSVTISRWTSKLLSDSTTLTLLLCWRNNEAAYKGLFWSNSRRKVVIKQVAILGQIQFTGCNQLQLVRLLRFMIYKQVLNIKYITIPLSYFYLLLSSLLFIFLSLSQKFPNRVRQHRESISKVDTQDFLDYIWITFEFSM